MEGEEQKQRQWVRFGAKSVWIQRFKDISGDLLRSGQTKSVRTILDLIRTGERPDGSKANALSVVLPTRYGKSDVIRLLSLYSRDIGVGASLVLSPSDFLKSQIVSANKVSDMASRLGFSNLLSSGFGELKNRKELGGHSLVNLVLGSSTIQMVGASAMIEPDQSHPQRHSLLRQSMEQLAINSGGKVLVMIDEAHECGDGMVRGRMVEEMTAAGCIVVLFTATPYRSDGNRIPGMRDEVLDQDTINRHMVIEEDLDNDKVKIEESEAPRIRYRLIPDVEVTFGDAWKEKTRDGKPILCKIDRWGIQIKLSDGTSLSDLVDPETGKPKNSARIRAIISACLNGKDRANVYAAGAKMFVENIQQRRKHWKESAGLVYAGNDYGEDIADGKLREIGKAIEKEWKARFGKAPVYHIATGNNENASDIIRRFAEDGEFDFLICKQMGSAGLDSTRIKTLLDLSATRTFAAFLQRVMRVGTPKYGAIEVFTGTVITLNDPLTDYIWRICITSEGGEHPGNVVTGEFVTVREYWKDKEEPKGPEELPEIDGAEHGGFNDHQSSELFDDPKAIQYANNLAHRFPIVFAQHTTAEIIRGMMQGTEAPSATMDPPKAQKKAKKKASGADAERDEAKDRLNSAIKAKCHQCYALHDNNGQPAPAGDPKPFRWWSQWVRYVGFCRACQKIGENPETRARFEIKNGNKVPVCPKVSKLFDSREIELMREMAQAIKATDPREIINLRVKIGG